MAGGTRGCDDLFSDAFGAGYGCDQRMDPRAWEIVVFDSEERAGSARDGMATVRPDDAPPITSTRSMS